MKITPKIIERVEYHQAVHTYEDYPSINLTPVRAPEKTDKILVIQPSSIGDVLCITPALRELRRQNPDAHISYIVEADATSILENGVPDKLLVAHRHRWLEEEEPGSEINEFCEKIADAEFDLVLNPHLCARSAWYATLAGGQPDILGLHFNQQHQPVLNANIYFYRWFSSVSENNFLTPPGDLSERLFSPGKLGRRLGLGRVEHSLDIALTEQAEAKATKVLEEAGLDSDFIVVHTGSKWERRRYKKEQWPTVIEKLNDRFKLPVALIGGPEDVERHNWIKAQTSLPLADFTAAGDLKFSAAILNKSRLLIGPDTATVHLAAAVNCPSLTITGPRWVGGYSAKNLVLSGAEHSTWAQKLIPDQVIRAAGFVLGKNSFPELPPGFTSSWTGDQRPNEFLREKYPARKRRGKDYLQTVLELAWENLCSAVNRDWDFPSATAKPEEIRDWLGPPGKHEIELIEEKIEELNEWLQLLEQYNQAVKLSEAGSRPNQNIRELGEKVSQNKWTDFLAPVTFYENAQGRNTEMSTIVKNYLKGSKLVKTLLTEILSQNKKLEQ